MIDESLPPPPGAASPDGVPPGGVSDPPSRPPDPPEELEGASEARAGKSSLRVAIEWTAVLGGALALALMLRMVLFQAYYIRFTSMEPTLDNGDRVLVNKLSYDFHDVNRGDLVVFERPQGVSGAQTDDLIKRVIALPGEVIKFADGYVYIDNRRLHEPYLESSGITTGNLSSSCATWVDEGCRIGAGEVFVMGDNRPNSTDSRSFGPISKQLIIGRAFLRIWPVNEFGWL